MPEQQTRRDFGLDAVRAGAVALVLAIHFFRGSGYYDVPLEGAAMTAQTVARMAFLASVPLFLMLTGHLTAGRRLGPAYYRKLIPVLLTYLVCGAACQLFRWRWMGLPATPLSVGKSFLDFTAAPYGWYVEMYLGLCLLTPFLSAGWAALDRRDRRRLVLALLLLTALPPLVNAWGQVLPDWWTGIYPVTYYFLGAWLREHPIRLGAGVLLAGWAGLAVLSTLLLRLVMTPGQSFVWAPLCDWGSILTLGEAVCAFTLLCRVRGEGWPRPLRWCVRRVARLSLPIYLISYITDQLIYPPLRAAVAWAPGRVVFLPAMVAVSLACSGIMGQGVDWLVRALLRLAPRRRAGADQDAKP